MLEGRFGRLWTASTVSAYLVGFALFAFGVHAALWITAPYCAGFVAAAVVSATTWRVFNRATVAQAYAEPVLSGHP